MSFLIYGHSSLAELWFNTSYQSTIQMTLFEALYRVPPPIHISYMPNDSNVEVVDIYMMDRESVHALLKHNLTQVIDRMKNMAHRRRIGRVFEVGDMVYLKLNHLCNTLLLMLIINAVQGITVPFK